MKKYSQSMITRFSRICCELAVGMSVLMPKYSDVKRSTANKKFLQEHLVELKLSFTKRGVVISMKADDGDWYKGSFVSWKGKYDEASTIKSLLVPVKIRK